WNDIIYSLPDSHLKSWILHTDINSYLDKDRVIWTTSSSGDFNTKSAYEVLRKKREVVNWHRLVWGKLVQPKHSLICWQLFPGSLPTQDRLRRKKILAISE
ncbi:hypothetical protein FRX31_013963, partial [Thalictrum thalictroides]